MPRAVGIDLGTTFSAIAAVNEFGLPELIRNREGDFLTPSVVLFHGNSTIVGMGAKASAVAFPLDSVQFVKRHMGNPGWKFRTAQGTSFSSEEVSAIVLKRLKSDAEAALRDRIEDAVISVPAYFDDAQRKATLDAGKMAGLRVLQIINEPTAAALAYGLNETRNAQTVLIYDLGGGTFDVTILRIDREHIRVLATGGDKNLGGFDWDNEVMSCLNADFIGAGGPDLLSDPTHEQILRNQAENVKEALSEADEIDVPLSANGFSSTVRLTRSRFEEVTRPLFDRTARIMRYVLDDSGLTWSQVDKVLLVGGSTRMKLIPSLVESVTGRVPSRELDPDKVVAMGAAVQAAILAGTRNTTGIADRLMGGVSIEDVNSHSMGVITLCGQELVNTIVLRRGTPYGTKVDKVFETAQNDQTTIMVQVTEGEEEELRRVRILGEKGMQIPPYPKGSPIRVTFLYSPDGLVRVELFDLTASRPLGELQIERVSNRTAAQLEMCCNRLAGMEIQ